MPSNLQPSRQQLENEWRRRAKDAKLKLDLARNHLAETISSQKTGLIPSTDGHYALQHAMRAENLALRHYMAVVKIFTELVVYGRIPASGESAGCAE